MTKNSAEWWIGQGAAVLLAISALGAYGWTAGGIVGYTLMVLIDIREYSKVAADIAELDGYKAGYQLGLRDGRDEGHNVEFSGAQRSGASAATKG